jgi:general nucleoside transport system permease protein
MWAALDILFQANFWAAAIRIGTPLIFGVLGALICERAGVLNLGIEGIFVAGAMTGWLTVSVGGDLWLGVAVAALTGAALGVLHGVFTVLFGLSQHVTGLGITLLATSTAYFGYRIAFPTVSEPPRIEAFAPLNLDFLAVIPILGPALAQQTALTWLAFLCVAVTAFVLARTPLGLALRAVGDNPAAVEAQGLSVAGLRIGALAAGSALMAIGGAFLTMSAFNAFFFGMVNGRGWVCIALTVFASWQPGKALLGALLFGAFDAYQVRLQTLAGEIVPTQVFLMLPYLLSILALVLVARHADYPRALMKPYIKGER